MARRARRSRADNTRWNQMIAALRLMNFAFNNIKIYPPTHTEVVTVVTKLHETLQPIIEEQEDIGFGFMDELLYIEGSMSIEETASNQMLVDRFTKCRVKYLTLMKGLSVQHLLTFFQILNAEAVKSTTEHPAELVEKSGITTIHIVEAEVDDLASKNKMLKKKTLLDWYKKAIGALGAAQDQLRDNPEADLKPLYRVVDDMMATIRNKGVDPFLMLPLLGRAEQPHLAHAVNTAVLCGAVGDLFGLNTGQINSLCASAFLHDLGRLTIPVEWTEDRSALSADDRAVAAAHPDWSFMLLARNAEVPPALAVLALRHHGPAFAAPPDGDGYAPDVFHQVLALADAYDLGLLSDRYYWRRHRPQRSLAHLIKRRGVEHDPLLVKLLVNCVGLYPIGSVVRLEDGRRAMVVRPNTANPGRPRVWLFDEPGAPPAPAPGAPE